MKSLLLNGRTLFYQDTCGQVRVAIVRIGFSMRPANFQEIFLGSYELVPIALTPWAKTLVMA